MNQFRTRSVRILPDYGKNQIDRCCYIVKNVNEWFASEQENCNDFLMSDGCDDENEYGAVLAERNLSSLNS